MSDFDFQAAVVWAVRAFGESATCDADGETVWALDTQEGTIRYGVIKSAAGYRVVNSIRDFEYGVYGDVRAAARKAVEFLRFQRAFNHALDWTRCTESALRHAATA